MLTVGIPKEMKSREKRVGLVPSAVESLCREGIPVRVESGAGQASGFEDSDYSRAGARILPDAASVFQNADLVVKVKEPLAAEYGFLRKSHILFCFLHLASPENCGLLRVLTASGATAIGYETLEIGGRLPLLAPMSEIAGGLSMGYAALFRRVQLVFGSEIVYPAGFQEKMEETAGFYPDFPGGLDAPVVIYGAGSAGQKALECGIKLKAAVRVVEKDAAKQQALRQRGIEVFGPENVPETVLERAEVLVGCVHFRGARALRVMDEERLGRISRVRKKMIFDVAIDQGGNFPQSKPTTYEDPVFLDSFGNLRFGVANIPSLCGRQASVALSKTSGPYAKALALDPDRAFKEFPELDRAVNVCAGRVLLGAVAEAHGKKAA